jgi:hypothetical protein
MRHHQVRVLLLMLNLLFNLTQGDAGKHCSSPTVQTTMMSIAGTTRAS